MDVAASPSSGRLPSWCLLNVVTMELLLLQWLICIQKEKKNVKTKQARRVSVLLILQHLHCVEEIAFVKSCDWKTIKKVF